jgi:hypothetical protein
MGQPDFEINNSSINISGVGPARGVTTLTKNRVISGVAGRLLAYMIKDANERSNSMPEPNEIVALLGIQLHECKDAIEELDSLGLVQTSGDASSPIGYARARLLPSSFIQFADQVLQDIDVVDEIKRTLSIFPNDGNYVSSELVLQSVKIPLARLQLIIDFLRENSLIDATEFWMGEEKLGFMHGRLVPLGKRILRGDDPLPVLNQYLA